MKKTGTKNNIMIMCIPIVLYVVFLVIRPTSFGNPITVYNVFQQSISSCIIAWGISFAMMMNQFDLAVGSEIVLMAILGAMLSKFMGVMGIVLVCVLGSLVSGLIKAICSKYLRIPSMILTVSLTYIFAALSGIITNATAVNISMENSILGQAPWNIIIFLIAGVLVYILHKYSPYGAQVRAVAGSEYLSKINGIDPDKIKSTAFILSSLFAGIAAIIMLSHGSSVAPTSGLASIATVLEPMMSVFIGMVLARFVNITFGIFIGAFVMSIISNGLIAVSMPPAYNNVVVGGVLIVLMAFINAKAMYDDKKTMKNMAALKNR